MYKKVLLATVAAVVQALQIGLLSDEDTCNSTNGDLRNKYNDGCEYYETADVMCGFARWEAGLEFDSMSMCCACGGGNRKYNCVSTEGALTNN